MASADELVIKLDAAVLQNVASLRSRLAAALVENRRLRRELAQAERESHTCLPEHDVLEKRTLEAIRRIVDDACEEAFRTQRDTMRGAINWGDLGCADVGTKDEGYYAVIEEADPAAWELCRFVADRLAAAGFDNVDVSTEW